LDRRGAAETVAVFALFLLLCSWAALWTFRHRWEGEVEAAGRAQASDFTRATALSVRGELNGVLESAVLAGMYRAGRTGGGREEVEGFALAALNERIGRGWDYPSLRVSVPLAENLLFLWRPDGSLGVRGELPASFEHAEGPRLFGLGLEVEVRERFLRLRHLASLVPSWGKTVEELNSLFSCEGITFEEENGRLKLTDSLAGRRVVV